VVIAMQCEAHLLAICRSLVTTAIPDGVTPSLVQCEERDATALLDEGVRWLQERGVRAEGALEFGNAVECIAEAAERVGADLVIVGHKPRGRLARWWTESDEATLLERLRCSVLVAVEDD
jgi:nucleotide-binding universal stress UspA family protein